MDPSEGEETCTRLTIPKKNKDLKSLRVPSKKDGGSQDSDAVSSKSSGGQSVKSQVS